jgi:hypothetical protein
MKKFWLARAIKCVVMIIAVIAAISWVVMSLWNNLLPGLFGWPSLNFAQALGLLLLSRILFGGLRGPGGGMHRRRRMFERWEQMTPEEREKLRTGLRNRCGPWGAREKE